VHDLGQIVAFVRAPSPSTRRMADPVISTRLTWAQAGASRVPAAGTCSESGQAARDGVKQFFAVRRHGVTASTDVSRQVAGRDARDRRDLRRHGVARADLPPAVAPR